LALRQNGVSHFLTLSHAPILRYSSAVDAFSDLLAARRPLLALAPMQDITNLPFWRVMQGYGGADLYYTEYLRVHRDSKPERHILRDIDENPTGRPVIAQMIGEDIPSLVRTAQALQRHPVFGIDLNLGCPAPIVCRKSAGGGLLRHLDKIDAILRALRPVVHVRFTVKTRIGYEDPAEFDRLLTSLPRMPWTPSRCMGERCASFTGRASTSTVSGRPWSASKPPCGPCWPTGMSSRSRWLARPWPLREPPD